MEILAVCKEQHEKTDSLMDTVHVFIIDDDVEYGQALKSSLEKEFQERFEVTFFHTGESALAEIKSGGIKPHIVLLDYILNTTLDPNSDKHTVDMISKASPKTSIIMLSDKEHTDRAMQALAHGAFDYVLKDKFIQEHVINSIKKALNPQQV